MRNRIARDDWTVDDDVVWAAVDQYASQLHRALGTEIEAARAPSRLASSQGGTSDR